MVHPRSDEVGIESPREQALHLRGQCAQGEDLIVVDQIRLFQFFSPAAEIHDVVENGRLKEVPTVMRDKVLSYRVQILSIFFLNCA